MDFAPINGRSRSSVLEGEIILEEVVVSVHVGDRQDL